MRRREFVAKTAALAGVAGVASAWPVDALVRHAGRVQSSTPFPSPSNMPIDNFVVLMQENRSFDHYFGWHPGADAKNAGLSYPDDNGAQHATHPLAPDFQGCAFEDPDHSWEGGRKQFNGGRMDGFRSPRTTIRHRLLQQAGHPVPPRPRGRLHPLRPLFLLAARPDLAEPRVHALGDLGRQQDQRRSPGCGHRNQWRGPLQVGDDLGPDDRQGPERHLLLQRPSVHRDLRRALPEHHQARLGVLCRRRGRAPPEPRLRGPDVPRRRRRQRPLGRRASARRHPDRAGLHVRRRPRLHLLAAVQDWGDVRQLRRVGRVLRPRRASPGPRRSAELEPRRELRHHRFPDPRRCDLAVCPARARQPHDRHSRVDPEAALVPVRPRLPEQAAPLRIQHRPLLRLGASALRATPVAGPRDAGHHRVFAAVLGLAPGRAGGLDSAAERAEKNEGLHIGSPEMLTYLDALGYPTGPADPPRSSPAPTARRSGSRSRSQHSEDPDDAPAVDLGGPGSRPGRSCREPRLGGAPALRPRLHRRPRERERRLDLRAEDRDPLSRQARSPRRAPTCRTTTRPAT